VRSVNSSAEVQPNAPRTAPMLEGAALRQAREREVLSVVNNILSLVLSVVFLVGFVVTGASAGLRDALGGGDSLASRIAFVLVFSGISSLVSVPLSFYFGYTVQKRYGLLKQNFGAWFVDFLKQFAVGLFITGALFTALYTVFAVFPETWLPISALVIAAFFGMILFLSPKIVRLQYKTQPLEQPEIEARVRAIFQRCGVPLGKVSQLMMGEKTRAMNAALVPDGLKTEVILADTLLEKIDPDGLDVVLAHELGHRVHRDLPKLMALGFAQFIVVLILAYASFGVIEGQFGLRGSSDVATLPVFMLVFTVVGELWSLLTNAVMRRAEYAADRYALEITRDPAAFERAFRVLATENLSDPNPPAWVEIWLHNHPSIDKRVAVARAWGGSGGARGQSHP
jgi:STE24 endopeptidase